MNQFINARGNLITEAIDGSLRLSDGKLARLDGFPHIKVGLQADRGKSKVALVSGAGPRCRDPHCPERNPEDCVDPHVSW